MVTFVEEYRDVVDRSEWGPGPWTGEPDKAVWVDEATGLDCMIVRNRMGGLCGYVGVPEGHPAHGIDYDNVTPYPEVHGGLTFADACRPSPEGPSHGICHIEQPGRPEHVWWLGFDCVHAGDLAPSTLKYGTSFPDETYKPIGYVVAEARRLARQLAEQSVAA